MNARSIAYAEDTTPTLRAEAGGNSVPDIVYTIQGNCIDRAESAGCNGKGWSEDVGFTQNTVDRHAVAYDSGSNPMRYARLQSFGKYGIEENASSPIFARDYKYVTDMIIEKESSNRKYIIRRLTP